MAVMRAASTKLSATMIGWLLLSVLPCLSAKALFPCVGCVSEHFLQSETYGIDLASDHIAVAVQHVNGTLEPIALTTPGPRYRSLMNKILMESDMHPYGYGNETPKPFKSCTRDPGDNADIDILAEEITKIATVMQGQNRNIVHYVVSTPISFTHEKYARLRLAFKESNLPQPTFAEPADFAAFTALNTTICDRHFELFCAPIDYNSRTIMFFQYDNSTMSVLLYHFWGGWYFDRVAYFSDGRLGHQNHGDEGHWLAISERITTLIEGNKDKISYG
ncbi:uncharacterized protein LY89DRAFT_742060 [Mollisia scopiformis]|uniref:Uncharacterized protein n=1 Tax=Mollisia scopiformis TaxID=149040 RepID=A0A132B730_MOLSC|nr:uncharacterized protein LY89DRAFT_742060 [Mollisia scopiformis]KUJ08218.1 hypothetical protein LY89DRAFT_742060 [Mollisia scopiformis]